MTIATKRESSFVIKSREFSREKRQLIVTNSLMGPLTQIERISNLISSYLILTPSETLSESMFDLQPTICNNDRVKIGRFPAMVHQKPAEFYGFLFSEPGFCCKSA